MVTALVLNAAFTPGFVVVQKIDTAGNLNASIAALEAEVVRRGGELNGSVFAADAQPQPAQPDGSQHHWYAMKLENPSGASTGSQRWVPVTVGFYSDKGQIVGELSATMSGGCSERRIAVERANVLLADIVNEAAQRSGIAMHVRPEAK